MSGFRTICANAHCRASSSDKKQIDFDAIGFERCLDILPRFATTGRKKTFVHKNFYYHEMISREHQLSTAGHRMSVKIL